MADQKEPVGVSEAPHSEGEKKEVKAWLRTLASTEKWRDSKGEKAGWKRIINEYQGNWDHLQSQVSIPIIAVNLVYAYVKTEIARMSFRDPWITVNAKRLEDLGAAQIAEQIINYTWGELKLKQQIKLALLEALLVGHSWIKVGYAAEFGTVESQPKEESDQPRGPGRPPKKYKEVETSEYIKSENVFAYHVPYKDVLFDPSATWPATHNGRWFAHRWVKPYRAVCQSGIYEHTDELRVSDKVDDPNVPFDMADSLKESFGKDVRSVTGWEIYDFDHGVVTTVSPGCEYKLREIPWPDYLKGKDGQLINPFTELSFNPVPGEVFPMSDIAAHEGQIVELTKLLSIELNHLKRWNRQLLVMQDAMTEQEEEKFKDANDGAVIHIQPMQGRSLQDNVAPVPYAPLQSDIYGVWSQLFEVWRSIAGQTGPDQGGQARTQTRTLGELRLQLQGGHARSDEKLDVLEDSIAEIARKLLGIMQKKYDLPKLARIVGTQSIQKKIMSALQKRPSAQPMTNDVPNPLAAQTTTSDFGFSWNRQDILGEMDVDVLAGSTVPLDREAQLQQIEKLFPYLAVVGIGPGTPASKALAREFLRLVGMMSLEEVMDLAEQSPPTPNPKVLETQAKVQAKAAETKVKIQGKIAEQQIKLQGMREDLQVKRQEHHMNTQKKIIDQILQQTRVPNTPQPEVTNGF